MGKRNTRRFPRTAHKALPLENRSGIYYTFAQAVVSRNRDKIFRRRLRHGLDTATVSIDITMSSDGESRLSAINEYDAAEARAKEARENISPARPRWISSRPSR